ncbi:MAG: exosome complex RNA-binding protein Rrp4 [Candidatus Woesearchaeota archaeon]
MAIKGENPAKEEKNEVKALVKDKEIVTPGEVLASGLDFVPGEGCYREGEKIISSLLGMVSFEDRVIRVIKMSGKYIPREGDKVIGKIIDILLTGWRVDINSPYEAILSIKDATSEFVERGADITKYFGLGDWLVCKVIRVTTQKLVDLSLRGPELKKLRGGRLITVNPFKIPRIIGKEGSMLALLKQATECNIVTGQNGIIWIDGQPEKEIIVVNAIRMIEEQAHMPGLTERVKTFLEKAVGKPIGEIKKEVLGEEYSHEFRPKPRTYFQKAKRRLDYQKEY